jgi:hypothetical protein
MDTFGLVQEDFAALDETLGELQQQGKVERAVYDGNHIEGAALLVHGTDIGVKAMDKVNNTSVFVLQVEMIQDRFTQIAKELAPQYGTAEKELFARMMERWQGQTGVIAANLAKLPDGTPLPMYDVSFVGRTPKVSKATTA